MRVEPVTAGAVAQHHGPVNTSVGSIMDLSPLGRVDNPSGGAELVAFRVSHNNVVSGELLQHGRTDSLEPGDLGPDTRPALLGPAVAGHPEIEISRPCGVCHLPATYKVLVKR